jgi:hypothetical protein
MLAARSISGSPSQISLSGYAAIIDLEQAYDALHREIEEPRSLLFDLSEVTFFDLPTLQSIIAITSARFQNGLVTQCSLPAGDDGADARQFLRRWQFQEAFRTATGVPFRDFVVPKDHKYFRHYKGDLGTSNYNARPPNTFFDEANSSTTPGQSPKQLGNSGIYVASRIVFEAMTNAVRHPGARFIQTTSLFRDTPNLRNLVDAPRFFPWTTWDLSRLHEKAKVSLGTTVFFGMLGVTLFGLLFTPTFYAVVQRLSRKGKRYPASSRSRVDQETAV